jgi:hypothetical protein
MDRSSYRTYQANGVDGSRYRTAKREATACNTETNTMESGTPLAPLN